MKKIEKQALKKLESKKQALESQKLQLLNQLLKNEEYKALHKKTQTALIDFAKEQNNKNKQQLETLQTQLLALGKKLNKNAHILSNEYMCNICKDEGFVADKPCSCLNKITSKMLMEESGINQEVINQTTNNFEVFDNPEKIKKTYALLEKWCNNLENSKIRNWALFGHAGTGKTHLMLHTLKTLISKGYFVHFTTAFNLNQQLLSQHTNFEEKNRDYLAKYLECDVLFIDDMGTEPKYKNVSENYLYLILNQRMIENKPVIFSTNFDLAQFEDFYGERIFSRLINKRTSKSLWFDGEDLRLKQN